MEFREAKAQVDAILDGEDEEREWFRRARALRADPHLEDREHVGELYQRSLDGNPLSPAERKRLYRDGPRLLGVVPPPAWLLKPPKKRRRA